MREVNQPVWQRYCPAQQVGLPASLTAWMLYAGSFMQNLKDHGVVAPQVKVVRQTWQFPGREESKILAINARRYAMMREVLIQDDGVDLMYARTIFPAATLTGKERSLANLKNRPLGSVLFSNPFVERSEFELACINSKMDLYQKILCYTSVTVENIWARRSVFYIGNKPLLLEEVFLPGISKIT